MGAGTVCTVLACSLLAASAVPLPQPHEVRSANGLLDVELTLQVATVTTASGISFVTRALDGTVPGPTLRLRAGDTLRVSFVNALTAQVGTSYRHNVLSAPDESNVHFHGLHVSGELPSDDTSVTVLPGETRVYTTTLPDYHLPGTHWLHPHRHGSSALHLGGGAALAIIVEDEPGTLPPLVQNALEVLLVVNQLDLGKLTEIAQESGDGVFRVTARSGSYLLVNGEETPDITTMRAGAWTRLRVVYAGWLEGALYLNVPGCDMQLLAKDGVYIRDFPRALATAEIAPGGRADVMLRCPAASTVYDVRNGATRIATITMSAEAPLPAETLPAWEPVYPRYLQDLRNVEATPGCACATSLGGDAVNGQKYADAETFLHKTYLGAVVDRDVSARKHPYHQHVFPFQLVSGFGGYNRLGDWHDTVLDEGVVRYRPETFTGKVMVHCHRLVHEDRGMMAVEYVNETGVNETGVCTCAGAAATPSGVLVLAAAVAAAAHAWF